MMKKLPLLLLLCLSVTGCSRSIDKMPFVYKVEIAQGNIVEQNDVKQLAVGMNREQIVYLLGTPVLMNALQSNRWDYYYSLRPQNSEAKRSNLVLHFDQDTLVAFEETKNLPEIG